MGSPEVHARLQQALGAAYSIERELGGGGMSRVFVADEAALGRKVVVKVLRSDLTEGISAERFKREVRLAARLQHPHIVPLLTAGSLEAGVLYYTMPFVEGESLRARLEREGAFPVADAVRVLRDVASALSYAQRANVVHRDIKPENILLADGGAVVADFGIAKAIKESREGSFSEETRSSALTAAGTSLGTPAYMAPEQGAGDPVDHRSDLYALGVVAYEMLVGRPPFDGRPARQMIAAHATEAPDPIAKRRPAVPVELGALVMRLLEKNPADRPQSADEVLRVLDAGSKPHLTQWVPRAAVWVLFGIAMATLGALLVRPREAMQRPLIAAITAPAGLELHPEGGVAVSADGARVAFVAADDRGATAIWVRSLDSVAARRVEGTQGGAGPFWSPDGTSLGFFAGGELRVADLRAGTRRALCPAPRPGAGTWTKSGVIVYSPEFLAVPLFQVPAAGGRCAQLTRFRPGDFDHRRPSALPDGRRVLLSSFRANATLVADLATGAVTEVRRPGNEGQFAPPDWLLFRDQEQGDEGPVYVQRLDLETLRPTGEPRVLLEHGSGATRFTSVMASARTLIALQPSDARQSLVWVNRQSAVVDSVVAPKGAGAVLAALSVGVSHDARRIAFGGIGMWIHDRDRNVATRVRAETIAGQGIREPAWSPGDSLIAYGTGFKGPLMLRVYHLDSGTSDSLFASAGRRLVMTPQWSPDSRSIAFQFSAGGDSPRDEIWIYSFADRRATRAWESPANLSSPRWSPDGRWLAYVSDETGEPEVYVRRVSGAGVAVRVSTDGGEFPRWRADGRELYYRTPKRAIMAVGVRLEPEVSISRPRLAAASPPFSRTVRGFEVSADGERFIAFGLGDPPVLTLLLDWAARLPR